jgi:hypothetical protein
MPKIALVHGRLCVKIAIGLSAALETAAKARQAPRQDYTCQVSDYLVSAMNDKALLNLFPQ